MTRCELVDRLFLVKRVGVDGKITQSSRLQYTSGHLLRIEDLIVKLTEVYC